MRPCYYIKHLETYKTYIIYSKHTQAHKTNDEITIDFVYIKI